MTAPGRNWHEVYLLVLTAAFAVSSWASGSEQQVIAATFPAWSQHIWYGGVVAGVVLALVGIALHTVTGLLLKRAALFWLTGLCAAYGAAFLAAAGRADAGHVLYVVPLVLAYAAVNLVRATQIRQDIDNIRHGLRLLGTEAP